MTTDNPYEFWGGAPEESTSSTVGIFVYIENENGNISKESLITIGKARELAGMLGSGVAAVLLNSSNEELAKQAIHAGADKVFISGDDRFSLFDSEQYTSRLTQMISEKQPEILLSCLSQQTMDFLPRVAQRLHTGLMSGIIALDIDTSDRVLLATRPAYNRQMQIIYSCPTARPQIVLLMPATFPMPIIDNLREGIIEKI